MIRPPPSSPLFPSTPLSRSTGANAPILTDYALYHSVGTATNVAGTTATNTFNLTDSGATPNATNRYWVVARYSDGSTLQSALDRKSTRLNSSHLGISYAVFC